MRKISVTKNRLADWLRRDKYAGDAKADLSKDLERLKAGEPIDYVIGWSDFCGCRIGLESRPLIPRPETELWTELAITEIRRRDGVKCLDLFSGSGCIGVAILKNCPQATADFGEKSEQLLPVIADNLKQNGISADRYRILRTNVFRSVDDRKLDKYDYILANPPYVPKDRKGKLSKSVTHWEPKMALFAKDEGLFLIKQFIAELIMHLKPGGQAWLEFDSGQWMAIKKILSGLGLTGVFHKDQYSRWRYVVITIND